MMNIIYSDSEIVVVEKPGGLLSVPGRGKDKQDCVVARLRRRYPECIAQPAVHRLDMYTSGLMVLAKTTSSHRNLSNQFAQRQVQKIYTALLDGKIDQQEGRIEMRFRLDVSNRPHQIHDNINGKLGVTLWKKIAVERKYTRVEFIPLTGRTHQLRVHAAHHFGLNRPIVGDRLYGKGKEGEQMLLHATSLSFFHPQNRTGLTFHSAPAF